MSGSSSPLWLFAFSISLLLALVAISTEQSRAQSCPSSVGVVNLSGLANEISNYNNFCTNGQTTHIDIVDTIRITSPLPAVNNSTGAVLKLSGVLADGVLEGVNRNRILKIDQGVVVIDGLMLINGKANGAQNAGGAIHNSAGDLTIINSIFDSNSASYEGGAVISLGTGILRIFSSIFSRNRAPSYAGAVGVFGDFYVENSSFFDNGNVHGGAIRIARHVGDINTGINFNAEHQRGVCLRPTRHPDHFHPTIWWIQHPHNANFQRCG